MESMTASPFPRPGLRLLTLLLLSLAGAGCQKKAELLHQAREQRAQIDTLKQRLQGVDDQIAALSGLGQYTSARPTQFDELKRQQTGLTADRERLQAERDAVQAQNDRLRQETDAYLAKYLNR